MRVRLAALAALVVVTGFIVAAVPVEAQGQAPVPPSLRVSLGDLFVTTGANLANRTGPACQGASGPSLAAQGGAPTKIWNFAMPFPPEATATSGNTTALTLFADDQGNMTGGGTPGMWHMVDLVVLDVNFASPNQGPAVSAPPNGFTVTARLEASEGTISPPASTVGPGASPSGIKINFNPNLTTPLTGHGVPLKLTITLSGAGSNVAVACSSKLNTVNVIRGMPGAGDIDGDGVPDAEDSDRDGDGVANAQEAGQTCMISGVSVNFADRSNLAPGRDSDGDGALDEAECNAGSDPTNRTSVPARARSLIEILMPFILLLVVLALIAGIVFVFLRFGRTAAVTLVSQPELFIPPGTKGKYEVAVQNLSKKGDPRTYQLVVSGMPEGWDAKLNADHVTLNPQGSGADRQSVWLEVEAPDHAEPESAVVTVKAVPLNKAGRKDTFKLPGKAETITSINVPPGSKVPVKRGGKIEEAKAAEPASAALPIDQLVTDEAAAKKLTAAGITDSELLRTADAAALHKKTKIPDASLKSWQQVADLIRLGVTTTQASSLATGGVGSVGALAQAEPADVAAKASADEKAAKSWVKAAGKFVKKHPDAAIPGPPPAPAAAGAAPAGAKPQLQVGGLRHEPPAFRQGEGVKSSVNVTNNGGAPSTIKLSLFVNDGLADVQTVTVKPGKTKDVQFKWTAQDKNKLNIRGEVVPG